MKIGIVARADDTGLGNQTHELVKMLNPEKILVIDSSKFHNKNKQHYEWYKGRNISISRGFPDNKTVLSFIEGLDVVISCEIFYNKNFIDFAKNKKVKTILQYNFEFLDYLSNDKLTLPDILLAPSLWRFEEVKQKFGNKCMVTYLPPPTDEKLFEKNREVNKKKSNRLLHVGGKAAIHDRNGTKTIIEMLKYSKQDYELVIKTQSGLDLNVTDSRVTVVEGNEKNREDLYCGYDAMILPRRYAGLCLPMNEALMSSLPVFMTNISPNNKILPKEWLIDGTLSQTFMTRTEIEVYGANPEYLAEKVDKYLSLADLSEQKKLAFNIAHKNFSDDTLKNKYIKLIKNIL